MPKNKFSPIYWKGVSSTAIKTESNGWLGKTNLFFFLRLCCNVVIKIKNEHSQFDDMSHENQDQGQRDGPNEISWIGMNDVGPGIGRNVAPCCVWRQPNCRRPKCVRNTTQYVHGAWGRKRSSFCFVWLLLIFINLIILIWGYLPSLVAWWITQKHFLRTANK